MKTRYFLTGLIGVLSGLLQAQQPQGIDVSHHQGTIDWNLVYQSGKVFAFVKATEGYTYNDPQFVTNMVGGTNAGVLMGAYHFARPDNNSAIDEAHHFLQVAGNYIGQGYLPPVLDLEDPPGEDLQTLYTSQELTAWVQAWLQVIEDSTGVEPIIYTNGRYTNYLQSSLNHYRLWIAEPDGNTNPPDNLGHWTTWAFKQYSWNGNVNGISGDVDLNVFNGTMTELNNMAQGGNGGGSAVLDCNNAVVLDCGDFYHGPASSDSSAVYSYGCNGWTETGPERVHVLMPNSGTDLNVVISGFQGDLDVYILNSCDPGDCVGSVYSSSAYLSGAVAGQTYYPVVDADDGSGSAYDIYVACGNFPGDISLNNVRITTNPHVNPGQTVDVYCKQYYAGSSSSLPDIKVAYYLSTDCSLDSTDILLGYDLSAINSGNRTNTETHTLVIPDTVSDGNYQILFVANADQVIPEATLQNNIYCVPLTVGQVDVEKYDLTAHIRLWPNPALGSIRYQAGEDVQIKRIEIMDLGGKLLMETENPSNTLDLSTLESGIYFIRFTDNRGRSGTFKVIRQ